MYSGNHSPCHPLDTLLEAARRLQDRGQMSEVGGRRSEVGGRRSEVGGRRSEVGGQKADPSIAFCFIGGGSEFTRVQSFAATHKLANIVCLPYQPLETLSASLSAADAHVVVMGDAFTGIVHPCKPYNVLAVGLPLLYIGPEQSHIADLLRCQGPEGSGQRAVVSGQRAVVSGQWSEGGEQRAEGKGQRAEGNGQRAEGNGQRVEGRGAGDQQVRHGEVDALVALIQQAAGASAGASAGANGAGPSNHGDALAASFSKSALLPQLIALVEEAVGGKAES